jgi:uncharacterized membrane protein YagU involved in acid resistance
MKSGPLVGAIGGLAAGIAGNIFFFVGEMIGLLSPPKGVDPMTVMITATVVSIIFGTIFGTIYSKLFDCLPGKAIMKGLYFGLMIWLIKDIAAGTYVYIMGVPSITVSLIWVGFFMWVAFGLVIGTIYKK